MEIPAGEFKAKCLQIMERVARTGKSITITKRGIPVAKLVPPDSQAPRAPLFGRMAGSVAYEGDLLNPVGAEWEALSTREGTAYGGLKHRQATHRVADAPRRKPR
jgi:prevent-host-death family protein